MEFSSLSDVTLKSVLRIRRFLYVPLISVILIVVLTFVVVVPNFRQIFTLRKEIAEAQEEFDRLTVKKETLESLEREVLDGQVEKLLEALPSEQAYLVWIRTLNSIAQNNNITLDSFGLSPGSVATSSSLPRVGQDTDADPGRQVSASSNLRNVALGFGISGSLNSIQSFFSDLESALPLIRIGNIEVMGSSQFSRLGAEFSIFLFYAPLPSQLGTVSRPILKLNEAEEELYASLLSFNSYREATESSVPVGRENIFAPF